jgi:hypothetical protein
LVPFSGQIKPVIPHWQLPKVILSRHFVQFEIKTHSLPDEAFDADVSPLAVMPNLKD